MGCAINIYAKFVDHGTGPGFEIFFFFFKKFDVTITTFERLHFSIMNICDYYCYRKKLLMGAE